LLRFQSHNGAIAALSSSGNECRVFRRFNPTMVRLLLEVYCCCHEITTWFQSRNGAIAAAYEEMRRAFQTSFNPTMVRLLLQGCLVPLLLHQQVSIPQWCDCCQLLALRNTRAD